MSGRRGCMNSLWSGTERVRIGERLKATLAGVLELELLRCKHLEMVDAALQDRPTGAVDRRAEGSDNLERAASDCDQGSATTRRQQVPSPSDIMVPPCESSPVDCEGNRGNGPVHSKTGGGNNSRWSTLSWDAPSDLLSPPTPDPSGMAQVDSDSRPSSGFYSVSGSSLSDSCYSVSSEAAQGGPGPLARPLKLWDQGPLSGDHSDTQWSENTGQMQQQPAVQSSQEDADMTGRRSMLGDLEVTGLSFLAELCLSLNDPQPSFLLPLLDPTSSSSTSLHPRPQLDPRYCIDLVSRRTKEVYPYPSPLHAVALQSPLFTSNGQEPSTSPSPEVPQQYEPPACTTAIPIVALQPLQPPASLTQLEQYISRLAHQYRSRVASSTSDLTPAATHRGLRTPGKSHGSTQSLSAFESRSTPSTLPGGSVTPCKSLLGNSARVSLSSIGKRASRNSINLGNLPSATGEDLNISLHLNLNLNLAPGLNASLGLIDNSRNGSCGASRNDLPAASTASATSLSSSTPTPAVRARSRISTCPSTLSHRSSLEVASGAGTSSGSGQQALCRSLDWSSSAPPGTGVAVLGSNAGSAPGSQRSSLIQESSSSPKLSEDSAMVEEISRLSGLSRAVVVGLMEQGVELDVDCFQADAADEVRGQGQQPGVARRLTQTQQSHYDYSRVQLRSAAVETDLNPQRPIQLSLSVTHSPQSHSGLTPPLSRSPQSQSSLTPPLSHSPLSHSNSPIHPYQSVHTPAPHYPSSHCHYQQTPSPSDPPSSTASSPASRPNPRGRSPPRPLQPTPLGSTPLSVFRRDAPSQCSLPRVSPSASGSPLDHGSARPRGGSLRQSGSGGGSVGGGNGWRRAEGEGLYRGKHASRELIRASTVSSFAKRESFSSAWGEEAEEGDRWTAAPTPRKTSSKLWKGWEGRLWGKDMETEREEMDRAEYGYGWRRNSSGSWRKDYQRARATSKDKRPKVEGSPTSSKRRGKGGWEKRSSSLRLSRRALFRSESQGLLEPRTQREESMRGAQWVSSLDVRRGVLGLDAEEGVTRLGRKEKDKRLSSTASLFNLSRSQSLEGSCLSLSPPLSSPSFSPSPPPRMPLQRSRSLRDLGRRVFGSMRSLSLKRKTSKK
ncbi:uncharacterized protein ACJ7VT_005840 [Polymixia lowei]